MTGPEAQALVDIAQVVKETLLPGLGEEVGREGLRDTPRRFASMILEMTEGLRTKPPEMTTFDRGDSDQMVTILDIDYWSLCEHHLVPFYGKAHVGYIPGERIGGLSKFGRIVEWFSKRPQTQEHMTAQVAAHLYEALSPQGVIVVVEGTHMCMAMRGIKKPNHVTITSALKGDIDKLEFFDILKVNSGRGS